MPDIRFILPAEPAVDGWAVVDAEGATLNAAFRRGWKMGYRSGREAARA